MSRRSGAGGGTEARTARHRGQSEIIGLVLLLGAILIGAFLTIAIGGMALQSVQENAQGGLTQDTAQQAHAALSEAAVTGDPQAIPMGEGPVDGRLVDGGTLTISMHDGPDTCSRAVREELGALRYQGGDRAVIYEGGAIWAETEAGLAVDRAPPISYDGGTTRISVLSVSAATTTDDGQLVARPNESARRRLAEETSSLLTVCPARDYTDLRITVSSPYSDGWERHFEQRVNTTSNVTVTRLDDDTVQATIENATEPRDFDGLAIPYVGAAVAVSPGEHFTPEVHVANGNYSATTGTVELRIDGTSITRTRPVSVDAFDVNRSTSFNVSSSTINASLTVGETYNYTVAVRNDTGTTVDARNGSFVAGTHGPMVRLTRLNETMDTSEQQLTIGAALRNYGLQNGTGSVTLEFTDPVVAAPNRTASGIRVNGTGTTTVGFQLDVGSLPVGHYEYAVHGPNGTLHSAFVIGNRTETTPIAGDLRLRNVSTAGTTVTEDDAFTVDTTVENVGGDPTNGGVAFRLEGGPNANVPVSLDPGELGSNSFSLSPSQVSALETGETHEYEIELASGNDTETVTGAFYLGESGSALGVEALNATQDDGTVTVDATLDNDGLANATDNATLTMYEANGSGDQVTFAETPTRTVSVRWGATKTVSFQFDGSSLGGNYTISVDYGNETGSDVVNLGALEGGDGDVAISGAGNGTVRVLGTEVSGTNDWYDRKYWAPISVTSVLTVDGSQSHHTFTNDETEDPGSLHTLTNLNSYDTQNATYSYDWTQEAGETSTLTVASTLWSRSGPWEYANTRTYGGETWEDYQAEASAYDDAYNEVNASSGDNPSNVRVLLDGDDVPGVHAAGDQQRSAAEILNQGAADRVDDDGTLDLGPNEAVFLFELSDRTATWAEADDDPGEDPDYNDVIAIVEFETPDGAVPVDMEVTDDGTGLVIGSPSVTAPSNTTISPGSITNSSSSGAPDVYAPGANGTLPGGPTPPEDVDVSVDVVTLG
ncbi:archaeal flagellin-like protein [Salinarchaeum sp. Harcht-Bsk1]|uniref:DUF7289 family protein n=1 Tax=Salinarchaeum sp. Harcht-Bsk1 TaxID=1333523 RepID=UPI0003424387|nr:hypothetical protein [Salinarchaeum sp. Harcht-Bsk1]AGN01482.1 archaeal flagellin-like protein [Salinarchaeum sp. Harcht-Bsk1]